MNPADLMTKPLAKPKIEQLMGIMVYEFVEDDADSKKGRSIEVGEVVFKSCSVKCPKPTLWRITQAKTPSTHWWLHHCWNWTNSCCEPNHYTKISGLGSHEYGNS